ncbi:SusC/RagA family TonB-linked outer membrane protein [Sphingobacterium hungaricum]
MKKHLLSLGSPPKITFACKILFLILFLVLSNANINLYANPHLAKKNLSNLNNYQTKVLGKVLDSETNSGIAGATITVVGKSISTQTNSDGSFEINAAINDRILVNYVGYASQQLTISSLSQQVTIVLTRDISSLEEVVVTGYGTQRVKDLTGSVAVVNVDELKTVPSASAIEALQGRATGVQVVTDGAPGATPSIKIRGFSTINNNEPLYVIDGVPFEGKLSWLNQNDIESMQVLKDASAASIYGARANNGVVIITTKAGKRGNAVINFSGYYGLQTPKYNTFPKMLSPQQILDINNELTGESETLPEYLIAGEKVGHDITEADVNMDLYNYDATSRETFYQITKANQAGTDWFREISQVAPTQSYQLSASGGNDNSKYSIAGGYLNQTGSLIYTGFERFNVRANTEFSAFNNKLRFGENLQYSFQEGFGMGVNTNVAGDYIGEGSVMGFAYRIQNIIPVYDEGENFAGSYGGYGNGQNPVAMSYRSKDNKNRSNFFFGNAFAEFDPIKGLTFRSNFGLKYETYNGVSYTYPNPEFSEGNFNTGMSEYFGFSNEWTWTNTLSYKKIFSEKHNLSIMAGTEAIRGNQRDISGNRTDYFTMSSLDYLYLNAGTGSIGNTGSGAVWSMYSLFAKADYSFMDRYVLSGTIRRDGSSNFSEDNLFGTFPGISGAWRISEEEFANDLSWLKDLKVRAGYGITGNQRISGFEYVNRYESAINSSSYPIGGAVQTGVWQNAYGNPDLKWEQVASLNLGLDFTIFNGDFDGSFDWYDKNTTDMLYRLPLPSAAVGGASSPIMNVGNMNNRGFELSLGYHYGHRQEKPFKFDLSANISRNVNKIKALDPTVTQDVYGDFRSMQTSILTVGEPFGAFYGYNVIGIYQNADELANLPTYTGARVGGLKFEDVKQDGVINTEDRTIIGSPHPDFVYSLNFNAKYKDFDLLLYFYGSQGNDIFEATRYFTDFSVFDGQKSARLLDAWSDENTGSLIPAPVIDGPDFEYESSSYYVQDGSFLKLKNLQIGYNLPTQRLFKAENSIKNLRVYFGVTNVLTFTKYTGNDPEVTATPSEYPALGVDFGTYPQARQYLLGFSLGF